jgi:hypothetical protein
MAPQAFGLHPQSPMTQPAQQERSEEQPAPDAAQDGEHDGGAPAEPASPAHGQGTGGSAASQSAFDRAPTGPPETEGVVGDARDDDTLLDDVTAPDGFGPAPAGYGPASAPAGAHGGDGTFGAEGAGGGPGNDPTPAKKEEDANE